MAVRRARHRPNSNHRTAVDLIGGEVPGMKMLLPGFAALAVQLGLAVLASGGLAAFFSHPPHRHDSRNPRFCSVRSFQQRQPKPRCARGPRQPIRGVSSPNLAAATGRVLKGGSGSGQAARDQPFPRPSLTVRGLGRFQPARVATSPAAAFPCGLSEGLCRSRQFGIRSRRTLCPDQ